MKIGSLFSGIGGFDLGLEDAGHEILWQCEANKHRRRVLNEHWPAVPTYTDVRLVGTGSFTPEVDMLCGGFPCQDLSIAGRRAGLEGERSGLFYEFVRIADELLPAEGWILIENVQGLFSSPPTAPGRDFAIVLSSLVEIGIHDLAWRVLDSQFFGVAQRRRRVYILGRRARGERARQVLLESEDGARDPQEVPRPRTHPVANTLSSSQAGGGGGHDRLSYVPEVALTLTRSMDGCDGPDFSTFIGEEAAFVRQITPLEAERIQGFPEGWTAMLSDTQRYSALGDAVTVNVARWIGGRL